ncbi:MAG TPA: hypothetical protein VIV12_11600 [Streptosporangiaceae bacterium]
MSKPSSRPSPIKTQSEPFDLDAVEAEASGKDFTFKLGGVEFVMPALSRLDRKAVKRVAKETSGKGEIDSIDAMLRIALGDEQWEKFDELPLTLAGVKDLFEAWSDHSGIDVGESSASTDS